MLPELGIENSGKKAGLHISPSFSQEKATANVSAVIYPFLQPTIIYKWLITGAGLLFIYFLVCNGKPDLGVAMSRFCWNEKSGAGCYLSGLIYI